MDSRAYLKRIGYSGSLDANLETLEALVWAHLQRVPFENFDVHLGREIKLDAESLFSKIVRRKRGGYCYELNGLFALLLRDLGFQVDLLSARVYRQGKSGQQFDHMALRVHIDGRQYLADVGFGDASIRPIEIKAGATREDRGNQIRLHESARGMLYEMEMAGGFVKGYELELESRAVSDFQSMSRYHQTSVRSWFTGARICILHTDTGTRSLIEGVLKVSGQGQKKLSHPGAILNLLRDRFELDLPRMPENKANTLSLRAQQRALAWEARAKRVWSFAGRLAA